MNRTLLWIASVFLVACSKKNAEVNPGPALSPKSSGAPVDVQPLAEPASRLTTAVRRGDVEAVVSYKKEAELGWSSEWRLNSMKEEDIDHGVHGVVLNWARDEGEGRSRKRLDAFDSEGLLRHAAEEVSTPTKRIAGGRVFVNSMHRLAYKDFTYEKTDAGKKSFYYELECFGTNPVSVYRSVEGVFWIDPYTAAPEVVPADSVLLSGPGDPAVERVRRHSGSGPRTRE